MPPALRAALLRLFRAGALAALALSASAPRAAADPALVLVGSPQELQDGLWGYQYVLVLGDTPLSEWDRLVLSGLSGIVGAGVSFEAAIHFAFGPSDEDEVSWIVQNPVAGLWQVGVFTVFASAGPGSVCWALEHADGPSAGAVIGPRLVPEPAGGGLIALALLLLAWRRRPPRAAAGGGTTRRAGGRRRS